MEAHCKRSTDRQGRAQASQIPGARGGQGVGSGGGQDGGRGRRLAAIVDGVRGQSKQEAVGSAWRSMALSLLCSVDGHLWLQGYHWGLDAQAVALASQNVWRL